MKLHETNMTVHVSLRGFTVSAKPEFDLRKDSGCCNHRPPRLVTWLAWTNQAARIGSAFKISAISIHWAILHV